MEVLGPLMPSECKKLIYWKNDLNKHKEVCQVCHLPSIPQNYLHLLQLCERPEQKEGIYITYAGREDINSDQEFTEAMTKDLEYLKVHPRMNFFDLSSAPDSNKRCKHDYLIFKNSEHVLFPDCLVVSASGSSKLIANANRHKFSIGMLVYRYVSALKLMSIQEQV